MRNILVPTDFSLDSDRAATVACTFAKALSEPIRLFHVFGGNGESWVEAERNLESRAQTVRDRGVVCHPMIGHLLPNTRILAEAGSSDVELVVMGTRARHGVQRVILGSFTEGVLRRIERPVVAVNPTARLPHRIETVLVGLDGSGFARSAFEEVIRWGPQLGTRRVVIAHAWESAYPNEPHPFESSDWSGAAARAGLDIEVENEKADPSDLILRAAEKYGADLIALGTHGRKGIVRSALGSVAENVVRRALSPVMTMRQPSAGAGSSS